MITQPLVAQNWLITGNSGTSASSNFVGNSDSVSLVFRTNNIERLRLGANGNLMLGITTDGGYRFNVMGGIKASSDLLVNNITIGKGVGTGTNNTVMGSNSFVTNTTGAGNAAFGTYSLRYIKNGGFNVGIGYAAGGIDVGDSSVDNSVAVGSYSRTAGSRAVAIGRSATALAANAVAVGYGATTQHTSSVALGYNTQATGNFGSISVGANSAASHTGSIVLGYGLSTTSSYQFLIGHSAPGYGIRDIFFGGGVTQSHAASYGPLTLQPTGQIGTNQTGQTIRIATGKGTGSGNSGDILFMTSVKRSSGDSLQNLATAMLVKGVTGNVGIGTTNVSDTSFRLFVEKGIRTRRVKVDVSSWADYVLRADYQLMPISDLKLFIEKYHHLPEVPSEGEVRENGLDLADNQTLLLKKIEELTLYIIRLNERVDMLEAENKLLKNK